MTTTCSECGATKPDGLSEEERAALDAFNAGRKAAGHPIVSEDECEGWLATSRLCVVEQYRAARRDLEAKVRELDMMVDQFRDALHTLDRDKSKRIPAQERQDETTAAIEMCRADIRANVARAEKRSSERIAALQDHDNLMRSERDTAISEVKRLTGELVNRNEYIKLADATLKHVNGELSEYKLRWSRVLDELAAAKAPKRCPADGMNDLEAGLRIYVHGDLEATGTKARELFTPGTDRPAAQPQGGNEGK